MNKDTRLSGVLHVLLHLDQAKEPLTSDMLAKTMGTNPAVFRRTMAGLRNAGYVHSEKGHGGGWSLARPLSEITLFDVYEALGHSGLFAFGLRNDLPDCQVEVAVNAALSNTMAEAEALLIAKFKEVSLDQITEAQKTLDAPTP
jgi:Rrf2 family protein